MFSISLMSICQTWAPLGAKWYYSHSYGLEPELTVVESAGDTMIDGKQCRVLKSYMISRDEIYYGIFRYDTMNCPMQYSYYDSGKVYLYDSTVNDFRVLYNFNAPVGSIQTVIDTPFPGFCPDAGNSTLFQYKVDSINDTVVNGLTLLRQYTSATQNADWIFSQTNSIVGGYPILEKIGSLKYLFGVSIGQPLEGGIYCLRCYEDSTLFYKASFWPSNRPCDYLTPIYTRLEERNDLENKLKIFPNPFRDYLMIDNDSKGKILSYEIFNSVGLIVYSGMITENAISIHTENFSPGFYFLKLKTDYSHCFFKIIKSK